LEASNRNTSCSLGDNTCHRGVCFFTTGSKLCARAASNRITSRYSPNDAGRIARKISVTFDEHFFLQQFQRSQQLPIRLAFLPIPACQHFPMQELVEHIAKALVDYPDEVEVRTVQGSQVIVFELQTHPNDVGKIIGREGRIINAIRSILSACAVKLHKRITLDIINDHSPQSPQPRLG
jgi:uncharacterized protein